MTKSIEARKHRLAFPENRSLGALYLLPRDTPFLFNLENGSPDLTARGIIEVEVESESDLVLSLSGSLGDDLRGIPAEGYDSISGVALRRLSNKARAASLRRFGHLRRLALAGVALTDDYIEILARNLIEELCLHNLAGDPGALSTLGSFQGLERLVITGHRIDDRLASFIASLKGLKHLYLVDCDITAVSLDTGPLLVTLNLSGSRLKDINQLSPAIDKKLERLDLSRTEIADQELAVIQKSFLALKELNLAYTAVTDNCLAGLLQGTTLEKLDLTGCLVSIEALADHQGLPQIITDSRKDAGPGEKKPKKATRVATLPLSSVVLDHILVPALASKESNGEYPLFKGAGALKDALVQRDALYAISGLCPLLESYAAMLAKDEEATLKVSRSADSLDPALIWLLEILLALMAQEEEKEKLESMVAAFRAHINAEADDWEGFVDELPGLLGARESAYIFQETLLLASLFFEHCAANEKRQNQARSLSRFAALGLACRNDHKEIVRTTVREHFERYLSEDLGHLARLFYHCGLIAEAEELGGQCLRQIGAGTAGNDEISGHLMKIEVLALLAEMDSTRGNIDRARYYAEKAVEDLKELPEESRSVSGSAARALVWSLVLAGDLDQALEVLALSPDDPAGRLLRLEISRSRKELDVTASALADLAGSLEEKLRKDDPARIEIATIQARILSDLGEVEKASACYEKALEIRRHACKEHPATLMILREYEKLLANHDEKKAAVLRDEIETIEASLS
ncbi:MAG: tetratricopeptide repeat protein [Cyanobacteria bacterium HKST-UBA02]|nr:tetratricopeptide repeat protein [Cyanobacteria bacterium HKST-UBA02]